jgi:hypothetical protein
MNFRVDSPSSEKSRFIIFKLLFFCLFFFYHLSDVKYMHAVKALFRGILFCYIWAEFDLVVRAVGWNASELGSILGRDGLYR